ncbi:MULTISPECIES: DNA adenine methylase [unclassified Nodularia (in: cyanobacteria)]|uniref:DNA adenine methylase n=1 Tax=unclassified Nodularia (in: cyanobacteria) TaxID=2656917 RepID=UPI001881C8CC|nr:MULTISPECIES: DNA adenine methylase [unclassified Nodularia (in: cyanobacteria)]MBE9201180.1 DNA adenine methylase [Nodularia sp. LEGE 06071]MCC2693729.1 DNA adenine methylase [Nodularia sp. LEGE 04288]
MKFKRSYKSPLRYPGGKQKDIPFLSKFLLPCKEFREPFLGGASLLLYALEESKAEKYWGNDLNPSVVHFWNQVKCDVNELADLVVSLKKDYRGEQANCKAWQKFRKSFTLNLNNTLSTDNQLNRAAKFFILNRSTSGGSTECGGMTQAAYCQRFTDSSIQTLRRLTDVLKDVRFTNLDYEEVIKEPGEDIFIFLDPPYLSAKASGLYGKNGDLHKTFDHVRLAKVLKDYNDKCKWLMTIDNCPEIKELYDWAVDQSEWEKAYGMTNVSGQKSRRGAELLIANFPIKTS